MKTTSRFVMSGWIGKPPSLALNLHIRPTKTVNSSGRLIEKPTCETAKATSNIVQIGFMKETGSMTTGMASAMSTSQTETSTAASISRVKSTARASTSGLRVMNTTVSSNLVRNTATDSGKVPITRSILVNGRTTNSMGMESTPGRMETTLRVSGRHVSGMAGDRMYLKSVMHTLVNTSGERLKGMDSIDGKMETSIQDSSLTE